MHPLSISVTPTRAVAVPPPPASTAPLLADAPTAGVAPLLLLFDCGADMSVAETAVAHCVTMCRVLSSERVFFALAARTPQRLGLFAFARKS